MVRAVRPSRSLSMARGCARIDSRIDTVKISLAGRVEVHHARLLAVIGVRKTFPHGLDPLGNGLVKSYSRPTENITGIAFPDLLGKRLEILKEALPQLSRVVVLMHTTDESRTRRYI